MGVDEAGVAEHSSGTASGGDRSSPHATPSSRDAGLLAIFPCVDGAPKTWPLHAMALIGRESGVDIQLADAVVSRRHAAIERTSKGFLVRDLGSRFGTFVDGQRVSSGGGPAPFGSVLRVGNALLLLVEDVARYGAPRRIDARFLGTRRDALAGPTLWNVWQQATRAASLSQPVLILGESGSGKEAIARLVHASRTRPGPFVALNLAAVPEGLFESELFGHVRGAFTGATRARPGAFREAQDGVLFLDEVGDLRLDLQVKLLRAIDQMRVRPLGATADEAVNARVVAATSLDLSEGCRRGTFRSDLYYRLSGIVLTVPALRERRDEIVFLAVSLLKDAGADLHLSTTAAEALVIAHWPGNVRQLENVLTQATVAALEAGSSTIRAEHLPKLDSGQPAPPGEELELNREAIVEAFQRTAGNATRAADTLGISRAQLYKLFKRYGLEPSTLRVGR
jgi:transcriptional regulator of acetoin/glycerol metabolism